MPRALTMEQRRELAKELRDALAFASRRHDDDSMEMSAHYSLGMIQSTLTRVIGTLENGDRDSVERPSREEATRISNRYLRRVDRALGELALYPALVGGHTE